MKTTKKVTKTYQTQALGSHAAFVRRAGQSYARNLRTPVLDCTPTPRGFASCGVSITIPAAGLEYEKYYAKICRNIRLRCYQNPLLLIGC